MISSRIATFNKHYEYVCIESKIVIFVFEYKIIP